MCQIWHFEPKFLFQFKKGSPKKFPMSVATMSRLTTRAYFRLYLKDLWKKFGQWRVKKLLEQNNFEFFFWKTAYLELQRFGNDGAIYAYIYMLFYFDRQDMMAPHFFFVRERIALNQTADGWEQFAGRVLGSPRNWKSQLQTQDRKVCNWYWGLAVVSPVNVKVLYCHQCQGLVPVPRFSTISTDWRDFSLFYMHVKNSVVGAGSVEFHCSF